MLTIDIKKEVGVNIRNGIMVDNFLNDDYKKLGLVNLNQWIFRYNYKMLALNDDLIYAQRTSYIYYWEWGI